RQEKAAKTREANLTKLRTEITEAQSLVAGANKSLSEERAALQRDESKLARREKQLEEHGRGLSVQEKELRSALDAHKTAIAKFESRSIDLERREEAHAAALADLEKKESGFAAERLEFRESNAELERGRKALGSDRKAVDAMRSDLTEKTQAVEARLRVAAVESKESSSACGKRNFARKRRSCVVRKQTWSDASLS